jgi:hypothetical protein
MEDRMATEWTLTINLRPLRLLRNMALVSVAAACTSAPTWLPEQTPEPPKPSQEELAKRSAVDRVEAVLSQRMSLYGARRRKVAETVVTECSSAGFDPLFVLAIIQVESQFDWEAVSRSGARGLMQIMPGTWRLEVQRSGLGHMEMFDPSNNVTVGIRYLQRLTRRFAKLETLLLAYNQGPGAAEDILLQRVEPSGEAASYAAKVVRAYRSLLAGQGGDARQIRRLWRTPLGELAASRSGRRSPKNEKGEAPLVSTVEYGRAHVAVGGAHENPPIDQEVDRVQKLLKGDGAVRPELAPAREGEGDAGQDLGGNRSTHVPGDPSGGVEDQELWLVHYRRRLAGHGPSSA